MGNVVAGRLVEAFAAAGAHELDAGGGVVHADVDGLVGRRLGRVVGAVVLEAVAVSLVDGVGGEVCSVGDQSRAKEKTTRGEGRELTVAVILEHIAAIGVALAALGARAGGQGRVAGCHERWYVVLMLHQASHGQAGEEGWGIEDSAALHLDDSDILGRMRIDGSKESGWVIWQLQFKG